MVVVNRCWLCESNGESVDHLLLHCGAAKALWNAFFSRFGLCWVMPSRSFLLAGGRVATRGVRLFGKWFLFALCGIFGGSVMALRTSRGLMKSYSIFFLLLFSPGLQAGWPHG
jgi:hypothetical protein